MELHTLRARLTAGLLNKAARGELALQLPTGLERDALGKVQKDPDREVQQRLELVFSAFLERCSANKVVQFFNEHELRLPRRDRFGQIVWKKPTVSAIVAILKNPAYAGAFVYGRTRTLRDPACPEQARQQKLPLEQWRIRVNDKYPAYISWSTFEKIQAMLKDNYAEYDRNKTRGVPRPGKALLHGLMYCGACGHKMVVQYKGGTRYLCNQLRQQHRCPVCQNLPADPIDAWVVEAFFQALSPLELDAYAGAVAARRELDAQLKQAREQQLARLRYQVELAERQFRRVDPDNRLVAAELEQRWELALRELKEVQEEYARQPLTAAPEVALSPELRVVFTQIGQRLPEVWASELLSQAQRKALLRCLIDKVVAHRSSRDTLQVRIVWKGGETTTKALPVTVGALADLAFAKEMEASIIALFHQGFADGDIAQALTAKGYRSPLRPYVLPSTVKSIRLRHGLMHKAHQSHPRKVAGKLTVTQLSKALGVPVHWLYDRIYNGSIKIARDEIKGSYLFPDTSATLTMLQQLKDGRRQTVPF